MSDTEDIRVGRMLEAFFVTQRQKRQPFEDARIGLRYPLLRLSLLGLSRRDERDVLLGAIFGAFAGLESRRVREAVLGAIGGAFAATLYSEFQKHLKETEVSWQEWPEVE